MYGLRIVFLGDLELWVKAELKGMAPQDPRAHAVDGADPRGVDLQRLLAHARGAQRGAHALPNFLRGGVRERDHEHLREVIQKRCAVRAGAGRERPRHPPGERERLAGTGTGLHKQGLVQGRDDLPLFVVQFGKVDATHFAILLSQLITGQ